MQKQLDKIEKGLMAGVNYLDKVVAGYDQVMTVKEQRVLVELALGNMIMAQEGLKEVRDDDPSVI